MTMPQNAVIEKLTSSLNILREKLIHMEIGGCTCNVKSSNLIYHDANCKYRQAAECSEIIDNTFEDILKIKGVS